jgi:LmbE family N-acetylglucosaminyl deacetylase
MNSSSLLAVFAHPDDESVACGGLLALAADRGIRVSLLCLTGGEGRGTRQVRVDELNAAARVLGFSDVSVLEYEDGMLPWTDADALERDIRSAIARTGAGIVVTFGEDGLYWHPDHIAVHERTTAAVAALGDAAPALYYVTMPPGQMRRVMDAAVRAAARANAAPPGLILGIDNPEAFGADAPVPTAIVNIEAVAARKLAAIRCHVSQLHDDAFLALGDPDPARLLDREHFHRAATGSQQDTFVDAVASSDNS